MLWLMFKVIAIERSCPYENCGQYPPSNSTSCLHYYLSCIGSINKLAEYAIFCRINDSKREIVDKFDETSSAKIVAAKQNSIIAIPCDEVHKECCILTPNDTKSADEMKPISMHRSTVSPSETTGQNIGTDGTFNESREMDRDTIENYEFDDNHECSAHASGMLRSSKLFSNHSMDDNNVREIGRAHV